MDHTKTKNIIQNLVSSAGFADEVSDLVYDEDVLVWLCPIKTNHHRLVSGRNADTITAFNTLLRKILEKEIGEELARKELVLIDFNNQQKNHIESLRATAHMMAERARYFKSSIDIDPMSAFDRRIIHAYLTKFNDIKTESTGEGKDRHIVVKYTDISI